MKRLVIVACLALTACATPYQDMGYRGGVSAQRLTAHTFLVTARGNAYTGKEQVILYVLRKAAEETIAGGDEWFVISSSEDTSRSGTVVTPGSSTSYTNATATGMGNMAYGTATTNTYSSPGYVTHYIKPGEIVLITSGTGAMPDRAVNAKELLANLTPPNG